MEQCSYFCFNIIRPKLLNKKKVCPLQSPISFRLGLLLLKRRREMVIFLLFFFSYIYIYLYTSIRGKKRFHFEEGGAYKNQCVCGGKCVSLFSFGENLSSSRDRHRKYHLLVPPFFSSFHNYFYSSIFTIANYHRDSLR